MTACETLSEGGKHLSPCTHSVSEICKLHPCPMQSFWICLCRCACCANYASINSVWSAPWIANRHNVKRSQGTVSSSSFIIHATTKRQSSFWMRTGSIRSLSNCSYASDLPMQHVHKGRVERRKAGSSLIWRLYHLPVNAEWLFNMPSWKRHWRYLSHLSWHARKIADSNSSSSAIACKLIVCIAWVPMGYTQAQKDCRGRSALSRGNDPAECILQS